MRDEFPLRIQRTLAGRVGHLCSNPRCQAPTVGPQLHAPGTVNLGKAAHITAASPGGPRFDASLTPPQRIAADNGIWLCGVCADLIDKDPTAHPPELLRNWKAHAESEARMLMGRAMAWVRIVAPTARERQIQA